MQICVSNRQVDPADAESAAGRELNRVPLVEDLAVDRPDTQ